MCASGGRAPDGARGGENVLAQCMTLRAQPCQARVSGTAGCARDCGRELHRPVQDERLAAALLQVAPGDALGILGNLLGRARCHNAPAVLPAAGPEVNHVVCRVDDVQVVLDDHDGGSA